MTYVIPPGFWRASFKYAPISLSGSRPVWGIGIAAATLSDLGPALLAWAQDDLMPNTSTSYVLEQIEIRSDAQVFSTDVSIAGTGFSSPAPPSVAALIKVGSGQTGRTNRGRIYWPGMLSDTDVGNDGRMTDAALLALGNVVQSLTGAITSASASPVILHSTSSDPTPATSLVVQQTVATQRRRLRK